MKKESAMCLGSQVFLLAEDPLVQIGLYHLLSKFSPVVIILTLQELKLFMLKRMPSCSQLVIAPNSIAWLRLLPTIVGNWSADTEKVILCNQVNISLIQKLIASYYATVLPINTSLEVLASQLHTALMRAENGELGVLRSNDITFNSLYEVVSGGIVPPQILHVNSLTKSECKVLSLVLKGLTPTKISSMLHRDIRTISAHKRNAMKKLDVSGALGLSTLSSYPPFIRELEVLSLRDDSQLLDKNYS